MAIRIKILVLLICWLSIVYGFAWRADNRVLGEPANYIDVRKTITTTAKEDTITTFDEMLGNFIIVIKEVKRDTIRIDLIRKSK